MYFVYILQSTRDQSYYTGVTTDLPARVRAHNQSKSTYSAKKIPFRLVWYCVFPGKTKAFAFERYLKAGSGFAFARKHLVP